MLNIINFAHGAHYMVGAFVAYILLQYFGVNYWFALFLVAADRRRARHPDRTVFLLRRMRGLDPLYGLLLTFGLALVIEGVFRNYYGSSGQPYAVAGAAAGRHAISASCSCPITAPG